VAVEEAEDAGEAASGAEAEVEGAVAAEGAAAATTIAATAAPSVTGRSWTMAVPPISARSRPLARTATPS